MARIELVIEELVLYGFDPDDGARIGDVVQGELTRLLAEQGLDSLKESVDLARLNAGSFAAQPNATPQTLGTGIAQSLHTGLRGVADV